VSIRPIWEFIAGDSRFAPLGVVLAIATAAIVRQNVPDGARVAGPVFVAILVLGLVAALTERV
jgi:hypothetical protein